MDIVNSNVNTVNSAKDLVVTSVTADNSNQDDLQSLHSEGIKIWGTTQEVLEKQALKELEIFVEEHKNNNNEKPQDIESNQVSDNIIFENYNIEPHVLRKNTYGSGLNKPSNNDSINNGLSNFELSNIAESNTSGISLYNSLAEVAEQEQISKKSNNYEIGEEPDEEPIDGSGSEYIPSEDDFSDEDYQPEKPSSKKTDQKHSKKRARKKSISTSHCKVTDDALQNNYKARLESYYERLEEELAILGVENEEKEYKKLKGGLKAPKDAWNRLYEYQKEGVYWLWELHQRSSGGLLGDEMGLGKTVQVIAFFHALQYSQYVSQHCRFIGVGPTIIVCPATVIHQWVKHFHEWSPEFRVAILHQSGTYQGNKSKLIDEINKNKGILVTTYAGVLKYKGNLCEYNWHYLILDEGHKIRNPTAKATVAVKHIRTPHRIMLTGSPMQNNLTELWSLFDFTNPGMLGNLAVFTEHFTNPILQGGYTNSNSLQEATAFSVASTLKNIISPFLLRRMKNEVQDDIHLPNKSEQVLFCSLTDEQRDIYKDYLMSEQINNILGRGVRNWKSVNFMKANMLMAITALRKICNHPDIFLYDEEPIDNEEGPMEERYGYYKRSGKMVVVSALLKIWKKQSHRTLLFCQGRSIIKIFELFLTQQGYKYLKMDGSTSISTRQGLINKFNEDTSYDVFLLTTRVGGLGVNLTGANRVIIYDPDWNPATDAQAKERAWRIGQEKSVTVYRLLSAGTVEEKMYQRQVWKQLLSNKVLIDPTTNKFFKSSDLFDLFSLPESAKANPETTNIFRDSRVKIEEKIKEKKEKKCKNKKKSRTISNSPEDSQLPDKVEFSEDKIKAMKSLAQQISKSLSRNSNDNAGSNQESKKNAYQMELEEERQKKLKEKEKLKHLTNQELLEYNRWKATHQENCSINKVDDKISNISFDKALEQSSKTADLYQKLTSGKIKYGDIQKLVPSTSENKGNDASRNSKSTKKDKIHKSKKRKHKELPVDTSGKINGEEVECLVKRETRPASKRSKISTESQDNYILEHLFTKKGVSGALEHESVLNGGKKQQSMKVRSHAEEKALKSLEALKKSRFNNWKW